MVEVVIAEPGQLGPSELDAAEALVRSAFGSGFRSHDWLHAVDGVHIVVTDADQILVGFAAVVPRTLCHNGITLSTGYVEAVAVRGDRQGRGLGRIAMDNAEHIITSRHQLGALNAVASAAPFYEARGWRLWSGPTQAAGPAGIVDTHDDADKIYLYGKDLDSGVPLICDWRPGHLW
ncbi:MAG: GNAT family N-acetyltransferase [Mycobacterium kyogaense]|uniref:GNAT family N-acetyltransferase n=1 Tax=Mycobacterium kyogaense TaxID=2212479 RepID=UPI002FF65EBF